MAVVIRTFIRTFVPTTAGRLSELLFTGPGWLTGVYREHDDATTAATCNITVGDDIKVDENIQWEGEVYDPALTGERIRRRVWVPDGLDCRIKIDQGAEQAIISLFYSYERVLSEGE